MPNENGNGDHRDRGDFTDRHILIQKQLTETLDQRMARWKTWLELIGAGTVVLGIIYGAFTYYAKASDLQKVQKTLQVHAQHFVKVERDVTTIAQTQAAQTTEQLWQRRQVLSVAKAVHADIVPPPPPARPTPLAPTPPFEEETPQ